jgi:hypothetical protein
MHWSQFAALFGFGSEPPRFDLRSKPDPIAAPYLVTLLLSVGGFIVLPYAEELWRCIRAAPAHGVDDEIKRPLRPSQAA